MRGGELPSRGRPLMIVRDMKIIRAERAGPFSAGDYADFVAPPQKIQALDAFLTPAEEPADPPAAESAGKRGGTT
jgi:hypothetical protein